MNTQDLLKARESYLDSIRCELMGPGSEVSIPDKEHEIISGSPEKRYSIGILFPQDNKVNADNDESQKAESNGGSDLEEDDAEPEELPKTESSSKQKLPSETEMALSEESGLDEDVSLATQNMPSSMGISFLARGNVNTVNCHICFATYKNALANECMVPFHVSNPESYTLPISIAQYFRFNKETQCLQFCDRVVKRSEIRTLAEKLDSEAELISAMYRLNDQGQKGYVRNPHEVDVSIDFGKDDYVDKNQNLDDTDLKVTALRRKLSDNLFSITIMLVNDCKDKVSGSNCIFQPQIMISSQNNSFVFSDVAEMEQVAEADDEEQSLALQYRNKKNYATGLGTAAEWDIDDQGNGILRTEFFPCKEVPQTDFSLPNDSGVDPRALSMKFLSDLTKVEKEEKLRFISSMVDAYSRWIAKRKAEVQTLDSKYVPAAEKNLSNCEKACTRMYAGIKRLSSDNIAWDAFQLANRAMYMQRIHLKLQEKFSDRDRYPNDGDLSDFLENVDYRTVDQVIQDAYSWRPFQLAFLLMSLESVSDDNCPERTLVDLIWFPTGGGKTEAYLGLTAYTIFYRRMAHPKTSSGTTVMMRYTLRLLAAQQFTRASTLICACELIRQDSVSRRSIYGRYPLGEDAITIGLWIGGEHTPNQNDKAKSLLKELTSATASTLPTAKERYNKFQILKCPWCGTKMVKDVSGGKLMGTWGYRMRNNRRFELFCPQPACGFNQKLPIQIVDQELYENPPTLLFGTVDKFAMLPWRQSTASFFGVGTDNRAPELIIQDELHLISGPLGTMVGLYETAVDALCSMKGVSTKIIASTATIRRAAEQCASLYNRETAQFPPPALDSDDSFFAREIKIDHASNKFGRTYVGLMPAGKTKAMMESRTMAALLQHSEMMQASDEIKDKFWTLTVYFNSLKELGKCSTLLDDDTKDYIRLMARRRGPSVRARPTGHTNELTSRVSTTELNETLDRLEKVSYSQENEKEHRYAVNTVLATNMISVGIDVARLNVMLLVGQPKLTSEYIQASSRIGRRYPGLAFILYDGCKSRDRSHYEQFRPYHESFYRHVEPTGVTPFSKPARERALRAVAITIIRSMVPELAGEDAAAKFSVKKYRDAIDRIEEICVHRASEIASRIHVHEKDESREIEVELEDFFNKWQEKAEAFPEDRFSYGERFMVKRPEEGMGRLMKAFDTAPDDPAFDTMTSMRNVDTTVSGNILIWEDKA